MGTKYATTISKAGPFFTKDPRRTFRQNVRKMMEAIASEGQSDIVAQLRAGEGSRRPVSSGVSPARVSAHVVGRVASVDGKPWAVTAKVSVLPRNLSRKQAVALMAAGSQLEGRGHAIRRTTSRLRSAKAVNQAELLKGLQ